jgi:sec-independent protein translocase protein TatA
MFGVGPWQILIVLAIVMLLFGNRLPALARSLGQSLVEFKKGVKEIDEVSTSNDSNQEN